MPRLDSGWTMSRMQRTVLIVDDHGPYRISARAMLEADGFAVVGEAATGAEAIAQARSLQPAIVLLDIRLPDLDGFEVAEALARTSPDAAVILISSRPERTYAGRLGATPSRGFIPKSELSGAAIEALLG